MDKSALQVRCSITINCSTPPARFERCPATTFTLGEAIEWSKTADARNASSIAVCLQKPVLLKGSTESVTWLDKNALLEIASMA